MRQGQLFYLMGASGVGKDSLLAYLRAHLPTDAPVILAQRHITRPADAGGEAHIEISHEKFERRLAEGGFAMHWQSHGFRYGIDSGIDRHLAQGRQVVVNGSRHYLENARQRYPELCPVLITVSHDKLLARLRERGRECNKAIEQRLQRAEALDAQLRDQVLIRLGNDGPLEQAGSLLLAMVLPDSAVRPDRSAQAAAAG